MKYYNVTFIGNTATTAETRIMSEVSLGYLRDNWAYTVIEAVPIETN